MEYSEYFNHSPKSDPVQFNEMSYLVKIMRFFLWFHRLTGLTFGGLDIDSNGKISVNKFYKIYGYIILVITIVYDIYHKIWMVNSEFTQEVISGKSFPTLKILPYIIGSVFNFLKWSILFFVNIFGFRFFSIFVEGSQNKGIHRINWKINLVILFWFIQVITVALLSMNVPAGMNDIFHGIMSMVTFDLGLLYGWSFVAIIWIISIHYTAQLNRMAANLKKNLVLKSGKEYNLFDLGIQEFDAC